MKIRSQILKYMHLDRTYCLLTGRNVRIILVLFRLIDVHDEMALNDVKFCAFMKTATDLNTNQIYKVFDMLDVDGSGAMDFDEFYLLICILIAVQDKVEKNFIYRHSRTVFDLLDEDNSGNISAYEFETFGFLFNLQGEAINIRTIFREFDVSGDQELSDYSEFKMFAMACIDRQSEIESSKDTIPNALFDSANRACTSCIVM
ncbi:EF-hand calcium-binding domain-containing protein 9-like [Acropora millepora]|uniref:EF-hand calcium-binding domain-containing protein 9-like n=1 Tax=Acropora millepora TaxID=45264 RepID=UPI001CF2E2F2|nr:EF-hand calcium-binding domain-containing protein 9-like [Acropora millepora]